MKKYSVFVKSISCAMLCTIFFTGCSGGPDREKEQAEATWEQEISEREAFGDEVSNAPETDVRAFPNTSPEETMTEPQVREHKISEAEIPESGIQETEISDPEIPKPEIAEPEIVETDWSAYFDGFHGAAVLYDASAMRFYVYNKTLAETRRSPCSTFKIASSLIALENGIIEPDHSLRKWSGETFWNEKWNHDIDFKEAFRESCVWYFREIIDEIGQELMQEELDRLSYGNCDISDWEGRLNTNNNNRALTGFWLESSLSISPMEQTEVMERIFGAKSDYSEQTREDLKEVMLVENPYGPSLSVYGKTGMGMAEGITVDAWYTGFSEIDGKNIYFCVYLGRTDDKNVTSAAAREIALRLISDWEWSQGLRSFSTSFCTPPPRGQGNLKYYSNCAWNRR